MIAVVAQVVATPVAAAVSAVSWLAALAPAIRAAIPLAGFALGGAVGGESLEAGRRGSAAFGCGGFAAGLVLAVTSPNLLGLTGYEGSFIVVTYAVAAFSGAFAVFGCIGAAALGRGGTVRATAAFAAAGAVGGVVDVLPFLVAHAGRPGASGPGFDLLFLASSVGAVAVPFVTGGSLTARAVSGR